MEDRGSYKLLSEDEFKKRKLKKYKPRIVYITEKGVWQYTDGTEENTAIFATLTDATNYREFLLEKEKANGL